MTRTGRWLAAAACVAVATVISGCGKSALHSAPGSDDPSVGQVTARLVDGDRPGSKPLLFIYHRPLGGEDACIEIDFSRPLSKGERSGVSSVVGEWYDLGDEGAFGALLTGLFPQQAARGGRRLQWDVNTDLVGPAAYFPLAKALHGYAYDSNLPLVAVRVVDPPTLNRKATLNDMCGR